jgi:hypothetical protein
MTTDNMLNVSWYLDGYQPSTLSPAGAKAWIQNAAPVMITNHRPSREGARWNRVTKHNQKEPG